MSDKEFEAKRGELARLWGCKRDQVTDYEVRDMLGLPTGPLVECLTPVASKIFGQRT
jgi:hypothetical protein